MVCAAADSPVAGSRKVEMPTSTAARPTKLCKMATSSGIDVMATRAAASAPSAAPMAKGANAHPTSTCLAMTKVTAMASTMPMMPKRLPRRAVCWLDSPLRLRMNRMAADR